MSYPGLKMVQFDGEHLRLISLPRKIFLKETQAYRRERKRARGA